MQVLFVSGVSHTEEEGKKPQRDNGEDKVRAAAAIERCSYRHGHRQNRRCVVNGEGSVTDCRHGNGVRNHDQEQEGFLHRVGWHPEKGNKADPDEICAPADRDVAFEPLVRRGLYLRV